MRPVIGLANIVTAFEPKAIGSRVPKQHQQFFLEELKDAIEAHDPVMDRQPGQHFIEVVGVNRLVECGVGKRTSNPDDYVVREHRGSVSLYLKRKHALPTESVHAVVYTLDAYLKDPDLTEVERARVGSNYTHLLVAVLSSNGGEPALSPYRFVHNLAGGNLEALAWSADEIRAKAKAILAYENACTGVAD